MSSDVVRPDHRWCESCNRRCESNWCVDNNFCAQVKDGCASLSMTADHIALAKLYNDRLYGITKAPSFKVD
jgi:hypothetical protein